MTALLPVLAMLACPIGMGLMMWLMMRGHCAESPNHVVGTDMHPSHPSPQVGGQFTFGGQCLNWKVIGGLVAVGGLVWIVAPKLIGLALPFLILLACSLSMLLMMRGMRHVQPTGRNEQPSWHVTDAADARARQLAVLRAEQEAIAWEIATLEATTESLWSDASVNPNRPIEKTMT